MSPKLWTTRLDLQGAEQVRARRLLAQALAQRLFSEFGVDQVILFGSTARGDTLGRGDIDLAVTGLAPELDCAPRVRSSWTRMCP